MDLVVLFILYVLVSCFGLHALFIYRIYKIVNERLKLYCNSVERQERDRKLSKLYGNDACITENEQNYDVGLILKELPAAFIYGLFKTEKKLHYDFDEKQVGARKFHVSTRNGDGSKEYTFQWKVENFSFCWMKTGEYLESPTFIANTLAGTEWSLRLFPKGNASHNSVSAYLHREKNCHGPKVIEVKYQLAFLNEDGLISTIEGVDEFKRSDIGSKPILHLKEKCSGTERKTVFLEDTLTIECSMWKFKEKPDFLERLPARTILQGNRGSFVWRIDKFSSLPNGLISNFVVTNEFKDALINFDLVLTPETSLYINIRPCDDCIKFCSFKASIIDWKGKKENCGSVECYDCDVKKGIISRIEIKHVLWKKDLYLRNDVLSLDCEYIFSTGNFLSEYTSCGSISSSINREAVIKKKYQLTPDLQDDLKSMYNDAVYSDVELRILTQRFPAHRAILSARSSVFRRMFSNDMKEKNSGHVDIADLDEETVHRMLIYIYTDYLGDLQMESTSKLYTAADKYDIQSLKLKCSSFLQDYMSTNTVCEVLAFADMHQDDHLKSVARSYKQDHDKQVLCTQEWKDLMATNLQLAADVMYRKLSKPREQH